MKLKLNLQTRAFWDDLQSSLWFRPFVITLLSIAISLSSTRLERYLDLPPLLNTSADNARAILTAIASSMLTVTSVTFSIVMVALALASQQFSPRTLRGFMGDQATQSVLGIFIGAFLYSMIVLGSISERDERTFIPVFSTLIALGFALLSVTVFIYFINHIAKKIHVNDIVATIANDTEELLHETYQDNFIKSQPRFDRVEDPDLETTKKVWAHKTGYLQGIDLQDLLQVAQTSQAVFHLHGHVGDFIVKGSTLLTIHTSAPLPKKLPETLARDFDIGHERTQFADVLFGMRQLVDIALKAISPAVNDPTTAINCLDYLHSILIQAIRYPELPTSYYDEAKQLRLIAPRVTFADMLNLAFDQIRQYSTKDVAVTLHLLDILIALANDNDKKDKEKRNALLLGQAESIRSGAEEGISIAADRHSVNQRLQQLNKLLGQTSPITLLAV